MHTCDDMLISCSWHAIIVDCSEIFDVRPTDDGFCCSFNTLPMAEQLYEYENDFLTAIFSK